MGCIVEAVWLSHDYIMQSLTCPCVSAACYCTSSVSSVTYMQCNFVVVVVLLCVCVFFVVVFCFVLVWVFLCVCVCVCVCLGGGVSLFCSVFCFCFSQCLSRRLKRNKEEKMHNPVVEEHDGLGGGGGGGVKLIFFATSRPHQTDGERTIRVSNNLILTSADIK